MDYALFARIRWFFYVAVGSSRAEGKASRGTKHSVVDRLAAAERISPLFEGGLRHEAPQVWAGWRERWVSA